MDRRAFLKLLGATAIGAAMPLPAREAFYLDPLKDWGQDFGDNLYGFYVCVTDPEMAGHEFVRQELLSQFENVSLLDEQKVVGMRWITKTLGAGGTADPLNQWASSGLKVYTNDVSHETGALKC